ncbi:hypothetical protein GCM10012276_00970 [Nocardioides deserti]|nr:hypothetical protein GCM10012276_00970 [Nocardioides deserti]
MVAVGVGVGVGVGLVDRLDAADGEGVDVDPRASEPADAPSEHPVRAPAPRTIAPTRAGPVRRVRAMERA